MVRKILSFGLLFIVGVRTDSVNRCAGDQSGAVARVAADNGSLDPNDPRSLDMKIRSLLRDEYTFFRGSAAAFYRHAAAFAQDWIADESSWVWLHGDIHIGNVGTYQGPGDAGRDIRFGVVDLDETIRGPFQLDLLRALTAVRFAARAENRPLGDDRAARAVCEGYARTLSGTDTIQDIVSRRMPAAALLRKAARNDALKYVDRYAEMGTSPHFRSARIKNNQVKDILEPLKGPDREQVIDAVWVYLEAGSDPSTRDRFRFQNVEELRAGVLDVARWTRVESSGSQGVHKNLVLLEKPLKGDEATLILELKEQPLPGPAVSGLLPSAAGVLRAREVAEAYGQMLDSSPRLVGYTRIGERGFLVRTKDPWSEDLEPADFGMDKTSEGAIQAAALLGEVLGLAHRNSLIRSHHSDRIPAMLNRLSQLPALLHEHSRVIEEQLRGDYRALQEDPRANDAVGRAEAFIKRSGVAKP